jgi:4-alpha-glucanotransferase
LLHPTSLPGAHGVGDLGRSARAFVDFLASAGFSIWQVLPLGPTNNHCPYVGWSALAGNPLLVDLEGLKEQGLLDDPLTPLPAGPHVDFDAAIAYKVPLLEKAAERLLASPEHPLYARFEAFRGREGWARRAAMFDVLKRRHGGKGWWDWEPALRDQEPAALEQARRDHAPEIARMKVRLFFFEAQWKELRAYCRSRGVRLLGDLPIYVDWDSVDVWCNRDLFHLDRDGRPTLVSGVPPDYFSETGQLWGNPLYRWDRMAKDDFAWWRHRLSRVLSHTDMVRIDHFRAFSAYWEVPYGAPDARKGRWVKGPGMAFFDAVRRDLGELPLVAEDLGDIDQDVHALRLGANLPGMRVLQFAFDGDPHNLHLPHNHTHDSVVYPGTHDNDTTVGWWKAAPDNVKGQACRYLRTHAHDVAWDLLRAAVASVAKTAILPMQDILRLGGDARMNNPALPKGNWTWRLERLPEDPGLAAQLEELLALYGRLPEGRRRG